jgi:hypothetical protein
MKAKHWFALAAVVGLGAQVTACSSRFLSCAESRTCIASGAGGNGDAGEASAGFAGTSSGASGQADDAAGGRDRIDSQGGAAGEAPMAQAGEAGDAPTSECAPGDQQNCWVTSSGDPITARAPTKVLGNCRLGEQYCGLKGSWGACTGAVGPAVADSCTPGDDANCNGKPNEGCTCVEGSTRDCGKAVGSCKQGKQTCVGAAWGDCIGEVKPASADGCQVTGDDANCNGTPNDSCPCIGAQTEACNDCGNRVCLPAAHQWGACTAPGTLTRACGNCGTQTCGAAGSYGACVSAAPKCVDSSSFETCPTAAAPNWVVTACPSNSTCQASSVKCALKDGQVCAAGSDCATGVCNVFHQDSDSDGYGSTTVSVKLCGATAPAGYVADGSDCCDTDAKAHPGQASYYVSKNLCNSFDYDCVGGEQLDPSTSAVIAWTYSESSGTCSIQTVGWATTPTCGSAGTYYSGPCMCDPHGSGENGSHNYDCSVATAAHAAQACH